MYFRDCLPPTGVDTEALRNFFQERSKIFQQCMAIIEQMHGVTVLNRFENGCCAVIRAESQEIMDQLVAVTNATTQEDRLVCRAPESSFPHE